MSDNTLKHLEFVQNTINRMSTNSFIIKGWAITLLGVILSFSDIEGKYLIYNQGYNFPIEMLIVLCAIFLFWAFNGYFLQQERRYISIYAETINMFNANGGLVLDMNYRNYFNSNFKVIPYWVCLVLCLLSTISTIIFINAFFLKLLCTIILVLLSLFIYSFLLPTKTLCSFWSCFIGRTVISVYGAMIILLLLINHAMFNSGTTIKETKVICECKAVCK